MRSSAWLEVRVAEKGNGSLLTSLSERKSAATILSFCQKNSGNLSEFLLENNLSEPVFERHGSGLGLLAQCTDVSSYVADVVAACPAVVDPRAVVAAAPRLRSATAADGDLVVVAVEVVVPVGAAVPG